MTTEEEEIEATWEGLWKSEIAPKGRTRLDVLKKTLYEYSMMMQNVALVYNELTQGRIQKPSTPPSQILAVVEVLQDERVAYEMKRRDG